MSAVCAALLVTAALGWLGICFVLHWLFATRWPVA